MIANVFPVGDRGMKEIFKFSSIWIDTACMRKYLLLRSLDVYQEGNHTMSEVLIYEENGKISVDVRVEDTTVWLSLNQLAELFERDKSVISRHIRNIFREAELLKNSVVAKYATTGSDGKTYQVDHYNLDLIISLGYRVNSKRGIQFRQWASRVLQKYLLDGYALNHKKLLTQGFHELENSISLLSRTLNRQDALSDIGRETIRIIQTYARSWNLLLQYDEQKIRVPTSSNFVTKPLEYDDCLSSIADFKKQLIARGEASELFGIERDEGLSAILGNLRQTFSSEPLYRTVEEVAAHLLYFVIKDHPFIDGNKRIGSFLFVLYLRLNKLASDKINEVTLVALALLVAESSPSEKELITPLVINLIS